MAHKSTKDFIIARDAVVGATCVLSILGAAAIVLSFLLLREVRTSVRFLLFNLSIADILVAVTNLVSISVFYPYSVSTSSEPGPINNTMCQVTGGVGLFAANSATLWTMAFMTYLYISIVCCRPSKRVNQVVMILVTIFCWSLPAVVAIVYIVEKFFSLTPSLSTGFCIPISNLSHTTLSKVILSYMHNIFLVPAFVIIPLLSIGFILHIFCTVSGYLNT